MTDESLNAGLELVVSDDSVSLKVEEAVEETDEFTPLSPEDLQEPIVEEEAPTEGEPVDVPLEDVSVETLDRLALYHEKLLKQASISQEDIHELKVIDPSLVTKEIGYFTEKPTRTNLEVTLEAINQRCAAIESYLKEDLRTKLVPSNEGC